ncbi:tetratricopeptide (TPR) repeat protein [Catenulispora sp. GP43]|uniref:ATP-binding protein n=1 Tax=Catenulispora sp. GP43 TaxID=3156263 RepID=UPI00351574F0
MSDDTDACPDPDSDPDPDPARAADLPEFIALLEELRHRSGNPSYRTLARRVGPLMRPPQAMPHSTIGDVFQSRRRRLNPDLVIAIVRALGADETAVDRWRQACVRVHGVAKTGGPLGVLRQLPADLPEFTGREAELKHLMDVLAASADERLAAPFVATIEGMGGVGKTQFAVHAAHRLLRAGHYTDLQLSVNLRGFDPERPPAEPAGVLDGFLRELGVPGQQIPETLDERAAMFRDRIHGRKALLLLDNAADARQVRDLLPAASTCLVLVTSRRSLADLEGADPLVLDVFQPEEARMLLAKVVGEDRAAAEPDAAERIVAAGGRLPLAVSIAAARLTSRPAWSLADLAARLESDPDGETSTSRFLDPVFDLSYRGLTPQASRMFRLLGRHPGNDFSAASAAALTGLTTDSTELLLERMQDEYLIDQKYAGRYEMHDLVRQYARHQARADAAEEQSVARSRLLDHYLHNGHHAAMLEVPVRDPICVPLPAPQDRTTLVPMADAAAAGVWFDAEFEAFQELIQTCVESEPVIAWQLAWSLVGHCMKTARYWEMIRSQTLALQAAEHVGDLTALSYSLQARVMAMTPLDMYDSVIADLNRSIEICRSTGDRFYEARGLCKISAAWCQRHDYAAGLEYALLALDVSRSLGVDGRTEQARSLNLVGWSQAHLGELGPAVDACEESVRLAEELGDLWSQAVALDSLAFAHREAGAYEMSAATYRRALAVHDRYGAASFRARTLTHLADLLALIGDVDEALALFREALSVVETADEQFAEEVRQRIGELVASRER